MHDVARLLRQDADRRARAHGMTRAQWVILFWLERQPGLSQKELSEILEVEPITVARLIDRLEARGMVERRADPKDRRIWRLHLRPPAEPVLAELHDERAAMHAMATADIDPATALSSPEVGDMLRTYRADPRVDGGITFGMNCIVIQGVEHMLKVGQPVGANYKFE